MSDAKKGLLQASVDLGKPKFHYIDEWHFWSNIEIYYKNFKTEEKNKLDF